MSVAPHLTQPRSAAVIRGAERRGDRWHCGSRTSKVSVGRPSALRWNQSGCFARGDGDGDGDGGGDGGGSTPTVLTPGGADDALRSGGRCLSGRFLHSSADPVRKRVMFNILATARSCEPPAWFTARCNARCVGAPTICCFWAAPLGGLRDFIDASAFQSQQFGGANRARAHHSSLRASFP